MFWKKDKEKRSLDEMLKPKDGDIADLEESDVDVGSVECEKENKAEIFSNEQLKPLDCFGWNEEKTEKWIAKCAKVWFLIMSFLYFLFGALTFAPIIFISNKVNVIFKDKKKSLLASVIIYVVCVALLIIFI